MQRYPLKWRQSVLCDCDFYQLAIVGRREVAPGERVSKLVADIRFCSAVYDRANLTPALMQAWAFYVPHRLVFPGWVDFIAMDDTVTAVPTNSTVAPYYLEPGSGTRSSLFRREYKMVYNQYFGEETATNGWFANVDDDTVTTLGRLLIWDQFRSGLKSGVVTQQSYLASVSGATATILLDDLAAALRDSRARRRQKLSGDKYVDTMRLMGVDLDWRVQMAPEFLGSSQQVVFGKVAQSASSTDLAPRATEWSGQHQLVIKRSLAFAEHGSIMVLAGMRPLVGVATVNPPEAVFTTQSQFFRPDTAQGPTATSASTSGERNIAYLRGRNGVGWNQNQNGFVDQSASFHVLYPDPAQFVPATGSGPRALSMLTDVSIGGLTPVPRDRA